MQKVVFFINKISNKFVKYEIFDDIDIINYKDVIHNNNVNCNTTNIMIEVIDQHTIDAILSHYKYCSIKEISYMITNQVDIIKEAFGLIESSIDDLNTRLSIKCDE